MVIYKGKTLKKVLRSYINIFICLSDSYCRGVYKTHKKIVKMEKLSVF